MISDLCERITLQTAVTTRDAFGAELLTWTDVATVWAKVVERGGREPLLADRPLMVVSYEVTIRAGVTVSHHDRVGWRGKVLVIDVVTPRTSEGLLVLRCVEVAL